MRFYLALTARFGLFFSLVPLTLLRVICRLYYPIQQFESGEGDDLRELRAIGGCLWFLRGRCHRISPQPRRSLFRHRHLVPLSRVLCSSGPLKSQFRHCRCTPSAKSGHEKVPDFGVLMWNLLHSKGVPEALTTYNFCDLSGF
jgi:hypothetical protein